MTSPRRSDDQLLSIRRVLAVTVCVAVCFAAGPDAKTPATQPASAIAGNDTSIAKDQYHFPGPDESEWSATNPDPAGESITYINSAHDGAIQLVLLPKDAAVTPASVAMQVATGLVKQLKQQHKDQKTVMVMDPKIEKDKRFAFVIHEKYKVGDKIADQLHIYKSVGPRVLMLTVNTTADDADKVADIQKVAEDLLDAVKFNRKAFKKSN